MAGVVCAKYVLGDSVQLTSLVALPGGGRIEEPKSDQAFPGGNSLLDYVVYALVAGVVCAKYVLGDSVQLNSLVAPPGGGKLRGRKVTRPVWEVLLLDYVVYARVAGAACAKCSRLLLSVVVAVQMCRKLCSFTVAMSRMWRSSGSWTPGVLPLVH